MMKKKISLKAKILLTILEVISTPKIMHTVFLKVNVGSCHSLTALP